MDELDRQTVDGLCGHWHKSLELPDGYQHFDWIEPEDGSTSNKYGVHLNDPAGLAQALAEDECSTLRLYTQHEIFWQDGVIKHTRSSPNWEGGLVTYATCKHHMRSTNTTWEDTWLAGLCPAHCEQNCLLFAGKIQTVFCSNYDLFAYLLERYPAVCAAKRASGNPRGDLYTPRRRLLPPDVRHDHNNYHEPPNHTRSVEHYKHSPGSISDRPDGKVPKWWRDLEYVSNHGVRPPVFIISPCWVFSRPVLWTTYQPRRAVLALTGRKLADSLAESVGGGAGI
jgi:hypothetical protein